MRQARDPLSELIFLLGSRRSSSHFTLHRFLAHSSKIRNVWFRLVSCSTGRSVAPKTFTNHEDAIFYDLLNLILVEMGGKCTKCCENRGQHTVVYAQSFDVPMC
jgi:hypothetical protein